MGESIFECTVLKWLVKEGDHVNEDDMIIEVATDKIDTEIGCSKKGIIEKFLVQEGDIAKIGEPICLIQVEGDATPKIIIPQETNEIEAVAAVIENDVNVVLQTVRGEEENTRFYSPLVISIAKEENISKEELAKITGTGAEQRVTKHDILAYIANKKVVPKNEPQPVISSALDEVIEMDRMRKMIAARMVESKQTSPHVTSFVETDMTRVFQWRNKIKDEFQAKTSEKITFTPLLIDAVVRAIKDFPMINVQVHGDTIIKKREINIGMAVALPNGNLIVPVIRNADSYNLVGLTKKVNDLANRARKGQLEAHELTGGTYTITNIGSFGNLSGTPIILQPQVAIMAFGVIRKVPAVIETPEGDVIGIRQQMIISHSYDHRVVDGSLGGMFARRVADFLENFETNRTIL